VHLLTMKIYTAKATWVVFVFREVDLVWPARSDTELDQLASSHPAPDLPGDSAI